MNFTELLAEVYAITDREDLESRTKSAIKAATLKMHKLDYFPKDLYETGFDMGESAFIHSFDIYNLFSNYRAFHYVKRVTDASDTKGKFLDIIDPVETLDEYGDSLTDVAYVAGRILNMRASVSFQYGLLGMYILPIVTETGYSSWVADLSPYAIIYEAARNVFKSVGDMEQGNHYRELLAEEVAELKILGLQDLGY